MTQRHAHPFLLYHMYNYKWQDMTQVTMEYINVMLDTAFVTGMGKPKFYLLCARMKESGIHKYQSANVRNWMLLIFTLQKSVVIDSVFHCFSITKLSSLGTFLITFGKGNLQYIVLNILVWQWFCVALCFYYKTFSVKVISHYIWQRKAAIYSIEYFCLAMIH